MLTPEPRLPGISVREAAIRLGTSESDIRRRIRRGELQAEVLPRAGGTLLRVLLPDATATPAVEPPTESSAVPEARQDAPAAITALVDALAQERAERQRLAERIAGLEREAGQLEGRAVAAEANYAALLAERTRERWRWWHRWTRGEHPPA